jgi:hypothetical protein
MLNLGIAPLELDAAPSRPLLYPLTEKHEQWMVQKNMESFVEIV